MSKASSDRYGLEDGTFEGFVARDGAVVGRTRLARQGDLMLVVERWLSDEERETREAERAAEVAEEAWWERFQSEDPLYLEMVRRIREHGLPEGSNGHNAGRTITCWFRRAEPRASADLEWAASVGGIRVQDYDDAGGRVASQMRDALSIKLASVDAPVRSLSGGNQQKVLIARWLALKPRILLMSEPTRGVDVGAKQDIVELIRALAAEGCTCVVASSVLEELLQVSNRIVVLNRGRVADVLAADEATKDHIILAATT